MKEDLTTLIEFRLMDPWWVARGSLFAVLAPRFALLFPNISSSLLVVFILRCFYPTL